MIRDFVAVIKHDGQAYYALFTFEHIDGFIVASNEYVKTWPGHVELSERQTNALLDATQDQFIGPMQSYLQENAE